MNCRRARRMISAYIDGEISPAKRLILSEHLMACERCRRRMMELKEVSQMVSSLPLKSAPLRIWYRLSSAMRDRKKDFRIRAVTVLAFSLLILFSSLLLRSSNSPMRFREKGEEISISSVLTEHSRIRGDEVLAHILPITEIEEGTQNLEP